MLVKSLALSVAAALLGPTLGIALFFLANSNLYAQPPALAVSETLRQVSFAPGQPWYATGAYERKLNTAAADDWQTVVRCPDGQTIADNGRCLSPTARPQT